ncbi:MAG: T9SS type A sorting domain-containing protein [Bacteroidetes bacterium]|nr:T9SS type A sorting domain-containing protein [Bacteroidota bacterium]
MINKMRLIFMGFVLLSPASSFSQHWSKAGTGFNFSPDVFKVDNASNLMYASGSFTKVGEIPVHYAAQFDGTDWDSIPFLHQYYADYNITSFQGKILFGAITLLSWDGNQVDTFAKVSGGSIFGTTIYKNDLVVYGLFDSIAGVAAKSIAKWNGVSWSAIDTTNWGNGPIGVAVEYQGNLYIGGNFVTKDGVLDRLAYWNGAKWLPVGNGIRGGAAGVGSFEIYEDDLYIGGGFDTTLGNPGFCVARWNGTLWKDAGAGMTSLNAFISDLQVFNGELYACGRFTRIGDVPILAIAKWDGYKWCGLGQKFIPNFTIAMNCMAVYNNELYVGGPFLAIDGDTVNYVAKWLGGDYSDTCSTITSVDEINNGTFHVGIFPSPVSNHLHCISHSLATNAFIQIYNLEGKIIMDNLAVLKKDVEIDVSTFSPGLYFLVLQDDKQRVVRKFVKE